MSGAKIENKATEVDPTTCPDRFEHRARLGRVCSGCGELIPGGNIYTPAQMTRYFPGAAIVETPSHPFPYTDEEAALIEQYAVAKQAHNDAIFEVEDLRRDGRTVRGHDQAAADRGTNITAQISEAEVRREKLREEAGRILLEHTRLGQIRTAKIAAWMRGEPSAPSGVLQRVGAALRGRAEA